MSFHDPTPNRPLWIKKPAHRDEEVDEWSQLSETEDAAFGRERDGIAGIRRTNA